MMTRAPHPSLWFTSPTNGRVSLSEALRSMQTFMHVAPERSYRLLIGTDSSPTRSGETTLVTAIVLHRIGNGGMYFYYRERFAHLVTLRQRMYQEALTSIDIAKVFLAQSQTEALLLHDVEIHVDIGHQGPTRDMIREIVGMVTASGFPVKTKPFSVAASTVADRHTVP